MQTCSALVGFIPSRICVRSPSSVGAQLGPCREAPIPARRSGWTRHRPALAPHLAKPDGDVDAAATPWRAPVAAPSSRPACNDRASREKRPWPRAKSDAGRSIPHATVAATILEAAKNSQLAFDIPEEEDRAHACLGQRGARPRLPHPPHRPAHGSKRGWVGSNFVACNRCETEDRTQQPGHPGNVGSATAY